MVLFCTFCEKYMEPASFKLLLFKKSTVLLREPGLMRKEDYAGDEMNNVGVAKLQEEPDTKRKERNTPFS